MIETESFGIILKLKGSDPARFLVVKQSDHWSFPKGHPEEREDMEMTVRRELFEETGIEDFEIIPEQMFSDAPYQFERDGNTYKKINLYVLGETSSEEVTFQEGEIFDARFATLSELRTLMTLPGQEKVLNEIEEYEKEN